MTKPYALIEPFLNKLIPTDLYQDLLRVFFYYMNKTKYYNLEFTKKIESAKPYNSRINMLFGKCFDENLREILMFLQQISLLKGYEINYEPLLKLINSYDFRDVRLCGLGLDLRDNIDETRIKVYIEYENQPNLIYDTLVSHNIPEDALNLSLNNEIMIGFDIYLNGKCSTKFYYRYPDAKDNKLLKLKLSKIFDEKIMDIIDESVLFYLTFRNDDKFIYLPTLNNIPKLLNKLGINNMNENDIFFSNIKPYGIAFMESEISKGEVSNANLYYEVYNWRTKKTILDYQL